MTSAWLCAGYPTAWLVARCIAGGRSHAVWHSTAVRSSAQQPDARAVPALSRVAAPVSRRGLRPRLRRMAGTSAVAAGAGGAEGAPDDGPVVQYVVLRKDLRDGLSWPLVRLRTLEHSPLQPRRRVEA